MNSGLLSVCVPLSPFYWDPAYHDFEASLRLSPFVFLLLDPVPSRFRGLPPSGFSSIVISWLVSLCPLSKRSSSIMMSRLVSLCLPSTGSSSIMILRLVSLCPPSDSRAQRSKSTIIRGLVSIWFPTKFLWFEVKIVKLIRKAVWGRCWCNSVSAPSARISVSQFLWSMCIRINRHQTTHHQKRKGPIKMNGSTSLEIHRITHTHKNKPTNQSSGYIYFN